MTAIHKFSRYDVLLSQFPFNDKQIRMKERESFIRLFDFLYEHTDIHYLAFIKEETLIQYLKYHYIRQFKYLSFTEVIQDIKRFIFYLKNRPEFNKDLKLDFSLLNLPLWIHLKEQ